MEVCSKQQNSNCRLSVAPQGAQIVCSVTPAVAEIIEFFRKRA